MINDWVESILLFLITAMLCLLLFILSCAAYSAITADNTVLATLNASEWVCTDTATERHSQLIGKVVVPKDVEVCIEYKHK